MAGDKVDSPTRHIVAKVFALVMVLAVVIGLLSYIAVRDVERGILEVCATQQDGYVQLVLDQINLKDNRDDEEIISDILETMDASSNKYWVFSQDQTMLFVKDVTETNKYKGFSAASYWGAADAQSFLDGLEEGVVKHEGITLDGVDYLASGSVFAYDGRDYRLCLLTNRAALLDNNDYLGARSRLLVVAIVSIGLLVIIPMTLAFMVARQRREVSGKNEVIARMSGKVSELSDRLAHPEVYDMKTRVWSADAFGSFVGKLIERGVEGAHVAQVVCKDADAAAAFANRASVMLDGNVVRFAMSDTIFALLFVKGDEEFARQAVERVLVDDSAYLGVILPVS